MSVRDLVTEWDFSSVYALKSKVNSVKKNNDVRDKLSDGVRNLFLNISLNKSSWIFFFILKNKKKDCQFQESLSSSHINDSLERQEFFFIYFILAQLFVFVYYNKKNRNSHENDKFHSWLRHFFDRINGIRKKNFFNLITF